MPRVSKEGKPRADSRGLGPPWGSGTSCVHPDLSYCVGVRSRHVSRWHGFEREPSAGRLARLPHSILVVEACSATTARGTAYVRPHCPSRITKVHGAAAPAQSPSAALIGYDGTALFHHAAYAASYAARSATWQATPLAIPGAVPTRQRLDTLNGELQEQTMESRREISFACDAIIMNSTLSCTTLLGPLVGVPTAMYASP